MIIKAALDGLTIDLDLRTGGQHPVVRINGAGVQVDAVSLTPYSWSLLIDGHSHYLSIRPSRDGYQVLLRERTYQVQLSSEAEQTVARLGISHVGQHHASDIKAPIPGLVASVAVAVGDKVIKGDTLVVLEAMKMENDIRANSAGVVGKVNVSPGDSVEKGAVMLVIEGDV